MKSKERGSIWSVERNIYGAWVIRGVIGMRQYAGYTKKEALRRYKAEVLRLRCVFGNSVIYVDGNVR